MTLAQFFHDTFTLHTLGAYVCRVVLIGTAALVVWCVADLIGFVKDRKNIKA